MSVAAINVLALAGRNDRVVNRYDFSVLVKFHVEPLFCDINLMHLMFSSSSCQSITKYNKKSNYFMSHVLGNIIIYFLFVKSLIRKIL